MLHDELLQLALSLLVGYKLILILWVLCLNASPVILETTSLTNGNISSMHIFRHSYSYTEGTKPISPYPHTYGYIRLSTIVLYYVSVHNILLVRTLYKIIIPYTIYHSCTPRTRYSFLTDYYTLLSTHEHTIISIT